jgi:hypothetical protein
MADRWVLNRAGILNGYQYGDETLTFAGGRLLLRGVNGSGKSTAMNMLRRRIPAGRTASAGTRRNGGGMRSSAHNLKVAGSNPAPATLV